MANFLDSNTREDDLKRVKHLLLQLEKLKNYVGHYKTNTNLKLSFNVPRGICDDSDTTYSIESNMKNDEVLQVVKLTESSLKRELGELLAKHPINLDIDERKLYETEFIK